MLGYPPRKPSDNIMVDAINWEWIIYCAQNCPDDIIIISRDTDYGEHHKGKSFLNDWLYKEFKERVSHRRSIILTRRLAEGFKLAGISVSREAEQAEESYLSSYGAIAESMLDAFNLRAYIDAWESARNNISQADLKTLSDSFRNYVMHANQLKYLEDKPDSSEDTKESK